MRAWLFLCFALSGCLDAEGPQALQSEPCSYVYRSHYDGLRMEVRSTFPCWNPRPPSEPMVVSAVAVDANGTPLDDEQRKPPSPQPIAYEGCHEVGDRGTISISVTPPYPKDVSVAVNLTDSWRVTWGEPQFAGRVEGNRTWAFGIEAVREGFGPIDFIAMSKVLKDMEPMGGGVGMIHCVNTPTGPTGNASVVSPPQTL